MTAQAISARQVAYLSTLVSERDTAGEVVPRHLGVLTRGEASDLIRRLEALPLREGVHQPATLRTYNGCVAGVYDVGGDVFRLRPNEGGTGLWAQQLIVAGPGAPRWEYAPQAVRLLMPYQRLDDEGLAERGRELSVCVDCGTPLSDPRSRARGVGPRCWSRRAA